MGVTIHFEGKLKSEKDYNEVLLAGQQWAEENEMEYTYFEHTDKLLLRVKGEEEWDYQGSTKGMRIQPDENSDPLVLEFDKDLYLQEYCKTQFAGVDMHVNLIEFLKSIEMHFEALRVFDEGEYWEKNDKEVLLNHIKTCFHQMELAIQNDSALDGPFKVADGRIADLMRVNE